MSAAVLQFLASLAAVAALAVLAHKLGFSRRGRIIDEREAAEILRLAPLGFAPDRVAIDLEGRGAIARDSKGALAVLVPHGGQFIPHRLQSDAHISQSAEGRLSIRQGPPDRFRFELQLGDAVADWAQVGSPAR